jgi:hypothetical protein
MGFIRRLVLGVQLFKDAFNLNGMKPQRTCQKRTGRSIEENRELKGYLLYRSASC